MITYVHTYMYVHTYIHTYIEDNIMASQVKRKTIDFIEPNCSKLEDYCKENSIPFSKIINSLVESFLNKKDTSNLTPSNKGCGGNHNCSNHPLYTSLFGVKSISLKSINGNDISKASDGRLWAPEKIIKDCLDEGLSSQQIEQVLISCDANTHEDYIQRILNPHAGKVAVKRPDGKVSYV